MRDDTAADAGGCRASSQPGAGPRGELRTRPRRPRSTRQARARRLRARAGRRPAASRRHCDLSRYPVRRAARGRPASRSPPATEGQWQRGCPRQLLWRHLHHQRRLSLRDLQTRPMPHAPGTELPVMGVDLRRCVHGRASNNYRARTRERHRNVSLNYRRPPDGSRTRIMKNAPKTKACQLRLGSDPRSGCRKRRGVRRRYDERDGVRRVGGAISVN